MEVILARGFWQCWYCGCSEEYGVMGPGYYLICACDNDIMRMAEVWK